MMGKDRVAIKVITQGDAVCGESGYMLKRGDGVVAFYLDGWGKTGRIYPACYSTSSWWDGVSHDYPSLTLEDGEDDSAVTDICFPEFEGWRVHSVSGGKTMGICLTRDSK